MLEVRVFAQDIAHSLSFVLSEVHDLDIVIVIDKTAGEVNAPKHPGEIGQEGDIILKCLGVAVKLCFPDASQKRYRKDIPGLNDIYAAVFPFLPPRGCLRKSVMRNSLPNKIRPERHSYRFDGINDLTYGNVRVKAHKHRGVRFAPSVCDKKVEKLGVCFFYRFIKGFGGG